MADSPKERKEALIAELARSRASLAQEMLDTRESLDVGRRLRHSILSQKTAWFTGAAITGWLIARLPGRRGKKQKPASRSSDSSGLSPLPSTANAERSGWLLALFGLLMPLVRPALTSYLTRYVTNRLNNTLSNVLSRNDNGWHPPSNSHHPARRRP